MTAPRILAFSGSARADSFNQQLVAIAAQGAREAGADVTVINLGDFDLPIFNEDLEAGGTPNKALELKKLFLDHDGLLIASPEYNSSVTPLLKNALDWVSRPAEGEPRLAAYVSKTAAIVAASPGGLGGLRGLVHLRSILANVGVLVLPQQTTVPNAHQAFGGNGGLVDDRKQAAVQAIGAKLAQVTARVGEGD